MQFWGIGDLCKLGKDYLVETSVNKKG